VDLIPEAWLADEPGFSASDQRAAYLEFLRVRLRSTGIFVGEAVRVRHAHV
jgi:hypothetical protein